jgi:hypothetical protein
MANVIVASAIIAILILMTSTVRAQRRTTFMIAHRHSPLVNITIIPVTNSMMTAPPDKEQVEVWHPRYRADKQLVYFVSKDNQKFAFDKEVLGKER